MTNIRNSIYTIPSVFQKTQKALSKLECFYLKLETLDNSPLANLDFDQNLAFYKLFLYYQEKDLMTEVCEDCKL